MTTKMPRHLSADSYVATSAAGSACRSAYPQRLPFHGRYPSPQPWFRVRCLSPRPWPHCVVFLAATSVPCAVSLGGDLGIVTRILGDGLGAARRLMRDLLGRMPGVGSGVPSHPARRSSGRRQEAKQTRQQERERQIISVSREFSLLRKTPSGPRTLQNGMAKFTGCLWTGSQRPSRTIQGTAQAKLRQDSRPVDTSRVG